MDKESSESHGYDPQIQSYVPMLHIPDVALNALFHLPELFGLATTSGDLCPSGDAGLAEVPYHVFVNQLAVHLGMCEHVRTGTDQTHVTNEHIEELWQFVNVIFPNEVAEGELARVVLGGLLAVGVLVDVHRAELIAPECLAVEPGTLLTEEHRTRDLNLDYHTDNQGQRNDKETSYAANNEIKEALDQLVVGLHQRAPMVGEEQMFTHVHRTQAHIGSHKSAWYIIEMHDILIAGSHDAINLVALFVWQAAKH